MATLFFGGDPPGLGGALGFGDEPSLVQPDTTPPVLTGSIGVTGLSSTGYTLTWPAGTDNVAVTGYQRSLDGGGAWVDVGNVLTANISGRTPGTTDAVRVRARDAAGNVSAPALAAAVTLLVDSSYPEPVTVPEAKLAARMDADDAELDALIAGYITAARIIAEHLTERVYVQATRRFDLADWPSAAQGLPMADATAVAIEWWDGQQWQPLDDAAYVWLAGAAGLQIAPALNAQWPAPGSVALGPRVRISVTAGSASPVADTPRNVKDFILAAVAHAIRNPEAGVAGAMAASPNLVRLLDPMRIWGF